MGQTEITFIRPQEVYDRNTGESKVRYRSYDGNDRFIPVVDGEKGVPKTMVEVTHAELKAMRDGGKLTAGALYRITDYQCTTTQENTQSAGHQFDIVLLALSANKLAEEGWAMEHPTDVYDVTFLDGVTKKCYLYETNNEHLGNIVDVTTLLGVGEADFNMDINIDEDNKTAICTGYESDALTEENLTYNYFQNSNLSAWKVWYCLDNDKSRFAWADTTNGKGVIYRMIDEFNNDIKYDFKNIQFKRKITNGQYDANGTETWCYTLNVWYNDMCQDASIVGNTLQNDEGYVTGVYDNIFGYATAYDLHPEGVNTFAFALGDNVALSFDDNGLYYGTHSNTIGNNFYRNTIGTYFCQNTIGNGFCNNTIKDTFTTNTIGNDFVNNQIDSLEYRNYGNRGVELATKS